MPRVSAVQYGTACAVCISVRLGNIKHFEMRIERE